MNSKLEKVLDFWFSSEVKKDWFQPNLKKREILDRHITKNYGDLLVVCEGIQKINSYSDKDIISIIIVLDQFSRHIYRNNIEKINSNTRKAVEIAEYLITRNNTYDEKYIPFILMPLKHYNIVYYFSLIRIVLKKYMYLDNIVDKNHNLYRFYIDCQKKYQLNDNRIQLGINHQLFNYIELESVMEKIPDGDIKLEILDGDLVHVCKKFLENNNFTQLVISLSGGPDSMVLAYIMTKLCAKMNIEIKAFHLNYHNRDESTIEEAMIQKFCSDIGLQFYVHRIKYFKRLNHDREFYEKITRQVRFNMYKLMGENIILGHIKEDLIENIWTNFSKGRDLFKLVKMDEISIIENVNILRPFLRVDKSKIYEFADKHNIPYLKNTTPEWSNRGKMRNEFIPATYKQFGKSVDEKILFMADSLQEYKTLLDDTVFKPFLSSITRNKLGIRVNIDKYKKMGLHFWQNILIEIFHSMGLSLPSLKSIEQFIENIRLRYGQISLKNNIYSYLDKDNNLYICEIRFIEELGLNRNIKDIRGYFK